MGEANRMQDFLVMMVVEFIRIYIIYQFNIRKTIMVDNCQPFKSSASHKLYAKYKI